MKYHCVEILECIMAIGNLDFVAWAQRRFGARMSDRFRLFFIGEIPPCPQG
jgi:hypothetical protein